MANISNRSPWQVKLAGQKEQKFRLKSKALEHLATHGHTDPSKLPKTPMARSNSPTLGHPKFPQAGRPDYDDSGVMAMRAAASLRR